MRAWERALHVSKSVSVGLLDYFGLKINKLFVSSEGACIQSNTSFHIPIINNSKLGNLSENHVTIVIEENS